MFQRRARQENALEHLQFCVSYIFLSRRRESG